MTSYPITVSSVRPTEKFPEKVENLKRWARFPGWNFRTECRVPFTFLVVCTSSRHGWAPRRTGVYDQMEQLFTNRKFHFCSHRNFRGFFLNGKRPVAPIWASEESLGRENARASGQAARGKGPSPVAYPLVSLYA